MATYQGANTRLLGNPSAWKTDPYRIVASVSLKCWNSEVMQDMFKDIKTKREEGRFFPGVAIEHFSQQACNQIAMDSTAFPWRGASEVLVQVTQIGTQSG